MSYNPSDLKALGEKELHSLRDMIDAEFTNRREANRKLAEKKIIELAIESGVNLKSLGASLTVYRNPANHLETWAGKGRKPSWLQELIAAGKSLDDLRDK